MWLYEIYKLLAYIVDSILTYLELGLYVIYTYILPHSGPELSLLGLPVSLAQKTDDQ